MAQTANITDGVDTVNLIKSTPGMSAIADGFGRSALNPNVFERAGIMADELRMTERWQLLIRGSSHDNAATQMDSLIALLRKAWRYHNDPRYRKPVYLTWKTEDETGTRYAIVHESPEMSLPDLFQASFRFSDVINNLGLRITRSVWRSGIPGVKGSTLTMTATDGPVSPELVHIANHMDDHLIDTIFRLDQGVVWAADFELGDPDYMWIADNASLSTGNIDFFIYGWFTAESLAADAGLMGKWSGPNNNQFSYLLDYTVATDRFTFRISDGAGAGDFIAADSLGSPAIDTLYFIVGWHTAGTSTIGIQVNDGAPDTKVSAFDPSDDVANFELGVKERGIAAFHYDGLMRSCGMCKAACTAGLRASLYNEGLPKFYSELSATEKTGLQAYWEFGSGGLGFGEDSHGANDLTNVGATQIAGTAQSWSADLIATAAHNIFPAAPAVGDTYYVGGPDAFFHVIWNLLTAGVYTSLTLVYEYSDGAGGWPDMTLGDDLTLYPDDEPWDQVGAVVLNWSGATDWAAESVNGQTKFWIRTRITALTAFSTAPANGTDVVYNQKKPYIEIPSTLLKGNISPFLMFRYRSPAGGNATPNMANHSRIIMGSKSRGLTKFQSHLNCGGDGNPADWAVSVTDPPCSDASIVADGTCPGGDRVDVDFAGDATMVTRVQITGAAILDSWEGLYRVFLRCQQSGGSAGQVEVCLRTFINETDEYASKIDGPEVALKGVDNGFEAVDLFPNGVLHIPFTETENSDDLSGGDLIFQIQAKRTAGAGTLQIVDLILIPADEYCTALNDPLSDQLTGNSALRGLTVLDDDSGVIANRTIKQLIDGAKIYPAETWGRRGGPPMLEPALQTRLYFLFCHYPTSWGTEPLVGTLGMHLTFELFAHNAWLFMRGGN